MIIKIVRIVYYFLRKWVLIKIAIIFYPIFSAAALRRVKGYDKKRPRILVIPQFTRIGDLVCATPVFRAIKLAYPDAYLAVLVTNRTAPIIKNNPRVDRIITFKSIDFCSRVLPEVRRERFDWSFNLSASAVGTLVSLYGFIPHRVKLTRRPRPLAEILADCLNTEAVRYEHHTYLPGYYLKMLRSLGIQNPEEVQEVFSTPEGDRKAAEFLRMHSVGEKDLLVGISITANNKIKEWGDEKFAEVTRHLLERYSAKVAILGSKKDEARIDIFLRRFNTNPQMNTNPRIFKAVDFSLEELPSFMKRLNLYIAVDTGPIYIAHALKVPLIDIVGPVDPREQPPKDERSIQVLPGNLPVGGQGIEPSSFVMKRSGNITSHMQALEAISVSAILLAIDKLLRNRY